MRLKNLRLAILAGFIAEIFSFFLAGWLVARGQTSQSIIMFVIGLIMAGITGENIKKIGMREYTE